MCVICKYIRRGIVHPDITRMSARDCGVLSAAVKEFPSALFPNLENLEIWDCSELREIPILPNLVELNIVRCHELREIPTFPRLKILRFLDCPNIRRIQSFPELKILGHQNPEKLSRGLEEIPVILGLEALDIEYCPDLRKIPVLPSLQVLDLRNCLVRKIHLPNNIVSVNIFDCLELEEICPRLERLKGITFYVMNCPRLRYVPNLEFLSIRFFGSTPSYEQIQSWKYARNQLNLLSQLGPDVTDLIGDYVMEPRLQLEPQDYVLEPEMKMQTRKSRKSRKFRRSRSRSR